MVPVVAALLLSVGLSIAANFLLFRSSLLDVPMRLGRGLISGTLIANLGLILIVVVLCLCRWGGARAGDLGVRRRDLGLAAAVTLATWVFLNLLIACADVFAGQGIHPSKVIRSAASFRSSVGELSGQLFGNALYEELLFRGVLLVQFALWLSPRQASPSRRVVFLAVLISQSIFALQHIPNRLAFNEWTDAATVATDLAAVFVSGLFLAAVFLRTRNLLIAVGMHTLVNVPVLLLSGPEWVHPVGMAIVLLLLIAIGPRLSRA